MKAVPLLIALGLTCAAPLGSAQDQEQDHSAHHQAQGVAPEATSPVPHEHGSKPSLLQENMKKIEALMQQIQQTTEPAQKRELLAQHLQALRERMHVIANQHSDMKMSMKEEGEKNADNKGGMMKEGGMMGRGMMMMHRKMEQRVQMLERLLQQVIEREAVEASIEQR